MRTLWLKIWVGTKLAVAALLLLYVLIFVYNNAKKSVTFWIWINKEPETSVLLLALYAFLGGAVAAAATMTAFRTYRQVKELRKRSREDRDQKLLSEMHAKAASLRAKPGSGEQSPPPSAT